MRLQLVAIGDRGIANQERIHLAALTDTDASFYVVMLSVSIIAQGTVAAAARPAFWFPAQKLKAGDNVVLYTRAGTPSFQKRADGGTDYFYFWGLNQTVFNNFTACAVLAELAEWQTRF